MGTVPAFSLTIDNGTMTMSDSGATSQKWNYEVMCWYCPYKLLSLAIINGTITGRGYLWVLTMGQGLEKVMEL